jgi:tripartite-type tricarboxylate transporter receptor subunit TctC
MNSMPSLVVWMLCSGMTLLNANGVFGQNFPTKPIRIVADSPGGGTDFVARLVARGLSDTLGQQVIVENRGGAGGAIAAEFVARAAPDGYTLILWSDGLWTLPLLRSVSYDASTDFSPIALVGILPSILVVHPSLPVKTVKQLIALAKARPGELSYASGGAGANSHLSGEMFKAMSGTNIMHVPYKGGGPGMTALMGGEVQMMFMGAASTMPHINSGRLRSLAVTTAEPFPLLPDMPTLAASGLPGYQSVLIYGIFAPARTPVALINQLNQKIVQAVNSPDVKDQFVKGMIQTVGSSSGQLAATVGSEIARLGKFIREAGIRAD